MALTPMFGACYASGKTAGAFLSPESERSIEQSVYEPFEPDRHFRERTLEPGRHAVNHTARNHGFADACLGPPLGAVGKQV